MTAPNSPLGRAARPAFVTSQFHGTIGGETGAGKTAVGNCIHAAVRDRLSFFFNSQRKPYIWGKTVEYRGAEDNDKIRNALRRGVTKFDIRPESLVPDEEHEDYTELLFRLAENGVSTVSINDEAHEYGGSKGSSVHRLHKRGREFGAQNGQIKSWSISQRYIGNETSSRSEAKYYLQVGLPKPADEDKLRDERNFPFDAVRTSHQQERFQDMTKGGETVSRAFSVTKGSEVVFGPRRIDAKYAEAV